MNDLSIPRVGLEIQMRGGEPRVYDLDLARRLGFSELRAIRKLIKRHLPALDELGPRDTVDRVVNGGEATEYYLNRRQAVYITAKSETAEATELTVEVVKRFDEYESGQRPTAIPTTAQALAHAFQMLADSERVHVQHSKAIAQLEEKVDRVEVAQSVQTVRPTNSESITHLRARVGKRFGLSAAIIDEVMRQSPYAPKPATMVKNDHVNADGSSYAVYWVKDVTAVFERFVSECKQVTHTMFTHPFIEGRFRMAEKGGKA